MKVYKLRRGHSLVRTTALRKVTSEIMRIFIFSCIFVFCGMMISCSSDGEGATRGSGKLRLNLSADTTSLKKGVDGNLTRALSDEFSDFLAVEDYAVCIMRDKDTIQSFARFDEMPAELSLEEGSYTLIASKGEDQPAAFENPYFEGSASFTIKKDMSTPIEATCTLANARITTEFTDDFKEAYSDYTVIMKSSFTSDYFEYTKGESRPVYLQVAPSGTSLIVGIRFKRLGEDQELTHYVPTTIAIERRQNIHFIFKTDGEALNGIGLEIVLDDSVIDNVYLGTEIPDFMWDTFKEPTLSPVNFNGDDNLETEYKKFETEASIGISIPGRIKSMIIKYWKDDEDEESATIYDLANDQDVKAAIYNLFKWSVGNQNNINLKGKTSAQLFLQSAINSLSSNGENDCLYHLQFYGTDESGKTHTTEILNLNIKVKPAMGSGLTITSDIKVEDNYTIKEGEELPNSWVLHFNADNGVDKEATKVIINSGTAIKEYLIMKEEDRIALKDIYGATVEIDGMATPTVTFPKVFSKYLEAPETYIFSFSLQDLKGNSVMQSHTISVAERVAE